ncbi:hypothetical protein [Aeropyrum pernix]|uniref:Uncharacterized protein n=2 Tax=Aeropyrum pernix TaxID=56636 RepID=A0A401HAG0_AERPX|nr:hypothetical protein [Aeropyrum pernix]GBF09455.1 hypothetical protein apy_11800 [Aeropyrum pernix]
MTPSSEDIQLYDEARKAFKEKNLQRLKEIYNRLLEIDANPEIVYIVQRMIDELEGKKEEAKQV